MSDLAPIREGNDAEPRKKHYGDGEQPWDTALKMGWGPVAAAFCVLRYLRRDKAVEHSLESARWYATRLAEGAFGVRYGSQDVWHAAWAQLNDLLTKDEIVRIGPIKVELVLNSDEEKP